MRQTSSFSLEMLREKLEDKRFLTLITNIERKLLAAPIPHIPKSVVAVITKSVPWFALIGGLMAIYGSMGTISFGLGSSPYYSSWVQYFTGVPRFYFLVTGVLNLLIGLLLVWAFKPLKAFERFGWLLLAWSAVGSIAATVFSLLFSGKSFFAALITTAIGIYLLFEVKTSYTKERNA